MAFTDRLHNRGSISTGFDIANSLKLEADNAEYLYYTPSTQTDYQRMAFSIWVKRTELGDGNLAEFGNGTSNTSNLRIGFDSSDRLFCYGNSIIWRQTNQVFRDTSAWYHLFFQFDTTQSTANDRIKIWVNGSMIAHTDFGVINNPGSGAAMGFNNSLQQSIGAQREGGPVNYFKGYIAQAYGSGGTPPSVTDFGEFDEDTGIWKPIDISELTPPDTAGFNLDFSDSSNLGNDISTRNNDFTLQNITAADQATDTPTNNFAILSHAMQGYYEDQWSIISDGGTKFRCTEFDAWITAVSSIGVTKGKWYAEFKLTGARNNNMLGIASMEQLDNNSGYIYGGYLGKSGETWGIGYYQANGNLYQQQNSGYTLISGWGSSISQNQTVGIAVDMDNHNLYLAVNNTYQNSGDPTSGATGTGAISFDDTETVAIAISGYSLGSGNDTIVEGNFGGFSATSTGFTNTDANGYGTFAYAPPSGYYALCSKNLAEFG